MGVQPVGNYAVQINWQDGFSQIAAYELLDALPRLSPDDALARQQLRARLAGIVSGSGGSGGEPEGGPSAAQQILQNAQGAPSAQSAPQN